MTVNRITILAITTLLLSGCSSSDQSDGDQTAKDKPANTIASLQEQLDERASEFRTNAPQELVDLFEKGVQDVAGTNITARALKVGDIAPVFGLPDHSGRLVNITAHLAQGPVVLTFYRGGWCPYCNLQLRAYQDILPEIERLGASLVAVSPQLPDSTASTVERAGL